MNIRSALKGQYHAGLAALRQAVERCPDGLWIDGSEQVAFWRVAYHTLFYTHFYLSPREADFRPWALHREEHQYLTSLPEPPHRPPAVGEPYTKAQILEYWRECDAMVDSTVDQLDLDSPDCGFWWYKMPKLDHQIMNIRHLQHHAAILGHRLRQAGGDGVDWFGTA